MAKGAKRGTAESRKRAATTREQAAVVRRYLEALQRYKPKRGRKRTPDSIKKRLRTIDAKMPEVSALQKLQLVQERMDLENELQSLQAKNDLSGLESAFVKVANEYGEQKRIAYAAWRELGVAPEVLKRAGVPRTRRRSAGA
jgi:hypothetical protein